MATENIIVRLAMEARDYVTGASQARKATDDITGAAEKTQSGLRGLAAQYGTAAKAAAGLFVAKQATDFARDSVRAFSDLNESLNAVEVGFGDGASTIKAFGEQAAETVGLSNSQFNQLSVTTGALLQNFITDQRAAADETIKLTQRASDMASVFNTTVPDALQAVQAGLRGETEPLRRFGVLLDDASVRARAVELGLAATTGEVDRQAKGLAALDLVYEQTANTAGDFANTSDGLANKQRILAAQFEDTKAKIGGALAPAFESLLDLGTDLLPALEQLAPAIGSLVSGFVGLFDAISPVIGPMTQFIDLNGRAISVLSEAFGSDVAGRANAFRVAQENVNDAVANGEDKVVAYANSLAHIARGSRLTVDQISALGSGIQFAGDQQTVAIGLALEAARAQRDYTASLNETGNALVDAEIAQQQEDAAGSVDALEQAFLDQIAAMDLNAAARQELIDQHGIAAVATADGIVSVEELADSYVDAGLRGKEFAKAVETTGDSADDAEAPIDSLAGAMERNAEAADRAQNKLRELARAQSEAASPTLRLLHANDRLAEARDALTELEEGGLVSADDLHAAQLDLVEAYADVEAANADLLGRTESSWEAFHNLATQAELTEGEIAELAAAFGLIPPETNADINISTNYTTRGRPTAPPPGGGIITPGNIIGLQHGGNFNAGQPIRVGEAGPEVLVPSTGGTVIPNQQLGGNTVQVFVESSGDTYDQVALALAMSGITETIEWAGSSTLRG